VTWQVSDVRRALAVAEALGVVSVTPKVLRDR
jgi:hypothetical protein